MEILTKHDFLCFVRDNMISKLVEYNNNSISFDFVFNADVNKILDSIDALFKKHQKESI